MTTPSKTCFVLMPFSSSFDGIWQEVVRPTVVEVGHVCIRADDFFAPGTIIDDVWKSIRAADYLLADLTGRNPNVFYELGIADALAKPVILLTQAVSDAPFDVRQRRMIAYVDNAAGCAALKRSLKKAIATL